MAQHKKPFPIYLIKLLPISVLHYFKVAKYRQIRIVQIVHTKNLVGI
jgi:hypothetical protein